MTQKPTTTDDTDDLAKELMQEYNSVAKDFIAEHGENVGHALAMNHINTLINMKSGRKIIPQGELK